MTNTWTDKDAGAIQCNRFNRAADYYIKPVAATATQAVTGDTTAVVSVNHQMGGIEIRFSNKPGASVIERLHGERFRYSTSHSDPRWYKRNGPGVLDWATSCFCPVQIATA